MALAAAVLRPRAAAVAMKIPAVTAIAGAQTTINGSGGNMAAEAAAARRWRLQRGSGGQLGSAAAARRHWQQRRGEKCGGSAVAAAARRQRQLAGSAAAAATVGISSAARQRRAWPWQPPFCDRAPPRWQ
jgi:hypothetical protein